MTTRILLVEDNEQNRYLATFLLENAGFSVVHAANGVVAVDEAPRVMPSLILMDIQMPEMDGYEAARRLLANQEVAHIPIVAITSYAMIGDRERALQIGFSGYIEKPIEPEIFVEQIRGFLRRVEEKP
jgi:two-component system, cell cycle response regulator DivK